MHVLDEFVDPVDDEEKARRNVHSEDARPNPEKLLDIGRRIWHLEEQYRSASMANHTGAVLNKRDVNKKKNKLSSRICRLKRKAQHEANKIKFNGLREEHSKCLITFINTIAELGRFIRVNQMFTMKDIVKMTFLNNYS